MLLFANINGKSHLVRLNSADGNEKVYFFLTLISSTRPEATNHYKRPEAIDFFTDKGQNFVKMNSAFASVFSFHVCGTNMGWVTKEETL